MRAVIYARYSSDLQSATSIDDQVEICRRLIEREGWQLVDTYADRAVSGASAFRDGYRQLIADAEAHRFDVVVAEALDRLGRKLADVATLYDHLTYLGIHIHTPATGEVTQLHIGMLGTMAQMYLADLREKTWRGQLGLVLKGRLPGGHAYGYDLDGDGDGRRGINQAEAAIVRRIFSDFAAGHSPLAIAKALNAEGIPGPGGRAWRDTAIRGRFDRGTGILNNELYIGRLVWNRCAYVKNPRTGKRVPRVNPHERWETVDVPDLRIVDDDLWERVKARQQTLRFAVGRDADGNALNRAHRKRYLLSGLLKCGICGSNYTIINNDRYGCATHRTKGTCANSRTITRQEIEARVLAGLKERLLAPHLVAEFVDAFTREVNRIAAEAEQRHASRRKDLADVERRIAGILDAIERGIVTDTTRDRLLALEARKRELEAALAKPAPPTLRIHPRLAEVYRDKVARLEKALDDNAVRTEAADVIRSLIERIVLTPTDDGMNAELHGYIARILAFSDPDRPDQSVTGKNCRLSALAGARSQLARNFSCPLECQDFRHFRRA